MATTVFYLYRLPKLAILQVLKIMDPINVIRLNFANSKALKRMFRACVSLGRLGITLGRNKSISSVSVGNFTWSVFNYCSWREEDYVPFTFGTLPYKATDHSGDPSSVLWYTLDKNTEETALKIASWILEMFPKTIRSDMYIDLPDNAMLDLLKSFSIDEFKEIEIGVDKDCDARVTEFINNRVKDCDVALLNSTGGPNYRFKIAHVKNLGSEELPLKKKNYFKKPNYLESLCHYVILSGKGVRVAHIQDIINDWMTGVTPNLAFVRIKSIRHLDMTNIVRERDMEAWNDAQMEQYRELTDFTEYFNERGIVIRSATGKKASIHVNNEAGTFNMVVWDTLSARPEFNLHNHIAF